MGLVINTQGVELNEATYVNQEGKYLFKLEKWELSGFTSLGDQQFKIHFKGVEVGTKEPLYLHSELFNLGVKSLWRIKQLEVALKSPEIYDIEDWMGRYVIANISKEFYEKDGEQKATYKVKSWEYSKANDNLKEIPKAKQGNNVDTSVDAEIIAGDISDEEIPF